MKDLIDVKVSIFNIRLLFKIGSTIMTSKFKEKNKNKILETLGWQSEAPYFFIFLGIGVSKGIKNIIDALELIPVVKGLKCYLLVVGI